MLKNSQAIRWAKLNIIKNKIFIGLVLILMPLLGLGVVKTPLISSAAAAPVTRYVSPTGTDNATCAVSSPCQHVQWAIDHANAGDTIRLADGTYTEQLTVSKDLRITGSGMDQSIVKAPAVLSSDLYGNHNIVELNAGATLTASKLTVAGPGSSNCGSINAGFAVMGGATLDISQAAVRDVRDNPFSGCQNGEAIRAGTQPGGSADTGHLVINHVTIANYNKNGVTVKGIGSDAAITHTTVTNGNHVIGSNGIEAASGALLTANHNTVTGNECNLAPPTCGSDFVDNSQSTGFLLFGANTASQVDHNTVTNNDIGIYADSGADINHNQLNDNRYGGITLDGSAGFTGSASVDHNTITGGGYGIWLGNMAGGKSTWSGSGTFSHNNATGNSPYDLRWDGSGTLNANKNHCGTATPSKAAWDCH